MKRSSLWATCTFLIAGALFLGCENQIQAPEAMTLQTRSAVEVLPADVQFVGMINLEAMQRNSAINPFEQLDMGSEVGARFQDFIDATGFDPEQDLREIYFAASDMDRRTQPNFVAYAKFDRDRLEDYIEQNMGDTFERTDYKGVTVYQAMEEGETFTFALATDNMMVGSSDGYAVEAMLDRLSEGGRSLKDNAETSALITTASGNSSAWFVIRDIDAKMGDSGHSDDPIGRDMEQIGQALKNVAVSVTMQEDGAEGTDYMTTRDGVSSSDVAALTKGVVAAMKGSSKVGDTELQMLDRVRVDTRGDQVRVNFFVDNAMLASNR